MATTTDGGEDRPEVRSGDANLAGRVVFQAAGEVNNVFVVGDGNSVHASQQPTLAERRLEFHFDVLKLKMKHAQWMQFFSVLAVVVGLVALLGGIVWAFIDRGSSHGYVAGASGLVASLGGGAWHRQAKRALDDLTKAAERNEDKVDADYELEAATTFIDRVQDPTIKDRLNTTAALKALNIHPNADMMFNNLLPGDSPKGIEPGDSAD
ncbi:hypothetical protein ABZ642_00345 [Streptomyces sp. NPDC007157]|uniref:TRADD-N-associated membrane domain-containing protein n=1 Tax=Streptomyces sp. NPDC007157 TaxID=3154681 RepID=UPI0033C3FA7B